MACKSCPCCVIMLRGLARTSSTCLCACLRRSARLDLVCACHSCHAIGCTYMKSLTSDPDNGEFACWTSLPAAVNLLWSAPAGLLADMDHGAIFAAGACCIGTLHQLQELWRPSVTQPLAAESFTPVPDTSCSCLLLRTISFRGTERRRADHATSCFLSAQRYGLTGHSLQVTAH